MLKQKSTIAFLKRLRLWPNLNAWIVLSGLTILGWSCTSSGDKLPILGQRKAVLKTVDGKLVTDSVYHTIPDFNFLSQYGDTVTAKTFANKIYVADFFFTSCPTICPKMKVQLKRVYEKYKNNPDVALLSHSIDPEHDTVPVLKEFADNLGITGRQWLFVTGDREKIYDIGQNSYMVTAQQDSSAVGGVVHSGAFILIDKDKHIRGLYDGTTEAGVGKLMNDMDRLLAEYKQ
ncbi:SCO family protein [Spirosoma sp. SC4-14]|uniref:SCO family protein n=1 Tax=Spirosoma sp. SC4-14 TaxID=3128900 RepID=UPI0030D2D525